MRKLIIIVLIIVVFVFLVDYTKDIIAKQILIGSVKRITGLKLDVDKIDVSFFKTAIDAKGFKLYNPSNFQDKLMADIPRIYIDFSLGALLKKTVHIYDFKLNLRELYVLKNKDGQLNLNSLKTFKKTEKKKPPSVNQDKFKIDVLHLKVGKVVYKDYSKEPLPVIQTYNVNIDEEFKNITNPKKIVNIVMVKALVNTAISKFLELDLDILEVDLSETLDKATKLIKEGAKGALRSDEKLGRDTEKTLKQATEALKKILPTGK